MIKVGRRKERRFMRIIRLFKTPWERSQAMLYTALTPNLESGAYYVDFKVVAPLPDVFDEELIAASRKAVGLH